MTQDVSILNLPMFADDVKAARSLGISDDMIDRVYEYYLACDVPEDSWWVQPFAEWLEIHWPIEEFVE